jgi:peptidoglycan/LPS O-acetylase OafA/YrhL
MEASKNTLRFHELDILRFLAALAVVFFHYTFLNATEYEAITTYPILGEIFKYGYLGVELFFIISGFVILLTASKKDWRGFIVSRVSRLYPAFWIAVTLTTLGIVFFTSDVMHISFSQYLWNLTMMGNFLDIENIDPVYWTLQVELKFYFWILLILLFKQIKHIEIFIFIWLVVALLEIYHLGHEFTHFALMPEWAPYFSAGALFYLIQTQGITFKRVGLLIFSYFLSMYFAIEGAEARSQLYEIEFSFIIVLSLITLFYIIFILIILGKTAHIYHPYFALLGATTYPLYLIHQKLGQIIYLSIGNMMNKYLLLTLVVILMIICAYLLHRYLEKGLGKGMKRKLESSLGITVTSK